MESKIKTGKNEEEKLKTKTDMFRRNGLVSGREGYRYRYRYLLTLLRLESRITCYEQNV